MESLRWILLGAGLLLLCAVYVWGRGKQVQRRVREDQEEDLSGIMIDPRPDLSDPVADLQDDELHALGARMRVEPSSLDPDDAALAEPPPPKVKPKPSADDTPDPSGDEKIISIYVVAHSGGKFSARNVVRALQGAGLRYGDMRIFHYYGAEPEQDEVWFSAANMAEPGWFEQNPDATQMVAGILLFMRVPGAQDPVRAFDEMVAAARYLQDELDGELRDLTRSVMSRQTIAHLREEIVNYCHKLRLKNMHKA